MTAQPPALCRRHRADWSAVLRISQPTHGTLPARTPVHGAPDATPSPQRTMRVRLGKAPAEPAARQHAAGSPGATTGWSPVPKAHQACGRRKRHDRSDIRVSTVGRGPDRDQREDPSTSNRGGRPARLSLRKDPPTRPGGGRRHVPPLPAIDRGNTTLHATPAGLLALARANGCRTLQTGPALWGQPDGRWPPRSAKEFRCRGSDRPIRQPDRVALGSPPVRLPGHHRCALGGCQLPGIARVA